MSLKRRGIPLVIGLVLSAVLVWRLLSRIELADFTALEFSAGRLALGFLLYLSTYLLRALRWKVLLRRDPVPLRGLFGITAIHTMTNNIFPSRTGEVSYVYLLKRQYGVPVERSVATLLAARVYDFVVMVVLFLMSVWFVASGPEAGSGLDPRFMALVVVALIAALLVLLWLSKLVHCVVLLMKHGPGFRWLSRWHFYRYLLEKGADVAGYLREAYDLRSRAAAGILSLSVWAIKFVSFMVLLGGILGRDDREMLSLGYWRVVFGATLAEVTTILPFYSPLGVYETVWAKSFAAVGMPEKLAISSGFAFHILLILASVVFAGLGSLFLSRARSKMTGGAAGGEAG